MNIVSNLRENKLKIISLFTTVFLLILIPILYYFIQRPFDIKKSKASNQSFDVIVVGAGSGGVSAAIQAARLGSSVLLIEKTDIIGGQMTSYGVSTMDGGDPTWTGGIYKEFIDKVISYYSSRGKTAYTGSWDYNAVHFEPSVGYKILREMVSKEPNITLYTNTDVVSVNKEGNKIVGLVTNKQGSFDGKVIVDATEYGDILQMSGASYRAGNSTNTSINQSACIQDITYPAIVKKYPNGLPSDLIISQPPPGYAQIKPYYQSMLSINGGGTASSWSNFIGYRGLPDSTNPSYYDNKSPQNITKTALNWFNDYPADVKYLVDKQYRKNVNCEAKLRTIQLLYYIQKDLGLSNWSVANDEGYDTAYNSENLCENIPSYLKAIEKNMPQGPYVRESLRAIGVDTLVARSVNDRTPLKGSTDSIAIGTYFMDLHRCNSDANLEQSLEKKSDDTGKTGPFTVPYGVLIPSEVDGLVLAEKNISVSRLANGAIRLQPITMLTGQAAGTLSSLSAKKNIQPRFVDVREVQDLLIEKGNSMLYPYSDLLGTPYFIGLQKLSIRGIITAGDSYSMKLNIKRGELAKILVGSFSIPIYSPSTATFSDVPKSYPYYDYVETIYKNKMVGGCVLNPLSYCPELQATNIQLAILLLRAWTISNPNIIPGELSTPTYADIAAGSGIKQFTDGLWKNGVKVFCDASASKFCPDDLITKGYAAMFIDNVLKAKMAMQVPNQATVLPTTTSTPISSYTTSPTFNPTTIPTQVSTTTPKPTQQPTQTPVVLPTSVPSSPSCINMYYCNTTDHLCRATSAKYNSQTQKSCEVEGQYCQSNLDIYIKGKTTLKCYTNMSACQSECI